MYSHSDKASSCCCCFCVPQSTVGIVTKCGRYEGLAAPGLHCADPCCVGVAGVVSLRVQTLSLRVQTKTLENVFVTLVIEAQFQVLPGAVDVAYYYLESPRVCIENYISASIRAAVPALTLDALYVERSTVAASVKAAVDAKMDEFGYDVLAVLILDIQPDGAVRTVMDQLLASRRLQVAAHDAAAAEAVLRVRRAEAAAELARLSAVGVAAQRTEVLKGLEASVVLMRDALPHYSNDELLHVLLTNQYLDVVKEVAAQGAAGAEADRRDRKRRGVAGSGDSDEDECHSPSRHPAARPVLLSSPTQTATERRRDDAEEKVEELEEKYAAAYGTAAVNPFSVSRADVARLREMYNELVAQKAVAASLTAEVEAERKAAEAFKLSGANVLNTTKASGSPPPPTGDRPSPLSPASVTSAPGPLVRHPRLPAGRDVLYMPHPTALRGLADQLIRAASDAVPPGARERAAAALMRGSRAPFPSEGEGPISRAPME